jgi:multiple sugar transport system permease protein
MTAQAIVAGQPRAAAGASLRRDRRWVLIASYFFLILFAIFFLTPPYYMIITSLKSDAEVAHLATNPWIISNGVTLEQYRLLFQGTDFLIYFKNTVIVTLCVVAITMVECSLHSLSACGSGDRILATESF